jgi:acetyl-CoA carboxylase beta subunit
MQPSEADSLLHESPRKRKNEEMDAESYEAEVPAAEIKARCPCPICGVSFFEEDINNHLDVCLNRSTVLELVRESDKKLISKVPQKIAATKGKPGRKRR